MRLEFVEETLPSHFSANGRCAGLQFAENNVRSVPLCLEWHSHIS